jgi:hypothetical protein
MDPIQEHLKDLELTASRQRPVLYGVSILVLLDDSLEGSEYNRTYRSCSKSRNG